MSQNPQRSMLAVLAALAAAFLFLRLRYQGRAPVRLPAENCDAALWKHVYHAERLRVIEACTTLEGRVVSLEREPDGDLHIELDPDEKAVLNLVNAMHARGHLVVESVCDHAPAGGDAATACAGFTPQVAIPSTGDRVRVTGAYVTDQHNGWNEVHPVTRIEILH